MRAARVVRMIGAVSGVLFVAAVTVRAQSVVEPTGIAKSIVDVTGHNIYLGAMYILGLVASLAWWFAVAIAVMGGG